VLTLPAGAGCVCVLPIVCSLYDIGSPCGPLHDMQVSSLSSLGVVKQLGAHLRCCCSCLSARHNAGSAQWPHKKAQLKIEVCRLARPQVKGNPDLGQTNTIKISVCYLCTSCDSLMRTSRHDSLTHDMQVSSLSSLGLVKQLRVHCRCCSCLSARHKAGSAQLPHKNPNLKIEVCRPARPQVKGNPDLGQLIQSRSRFATCAPTCDSLMRTSRHDRLTPRPRPVPG
jgi:hypothetical protein